jgi:cysteine sulfinate desulfinase/cysteine desulfurase-like protein
LNNSSTAYNQTGIFNYSDVSYPEVKEVRTELDLLKQKIRSLVGASPNSYVIFNSGSTESIANCLFWAKDINQYGAVVGSEFDHFSVEDNAKNLEMSYVKMNKTDMRNNNYIIETSKYCPNCIFITHVDAKTGEIFDVDSFNIVMNQYKYILNGGRTTNNSKKDLKTKLKSKKKKDNSESESESEEKPIYQLENEAADEEEADDDNKIFSGIKFDYIMQMKPLVILDCAQSITKVPIEMEKWGVDALFFSLHKICGKQGLGVLIVDEKNYKFKPLIKGSQQDGLRGGTFPLDYILEEDDIFEEKYNKVELRVKPWKEYFSFIDEQLKDNLELKLYKPMFPHLNNTFLILSSSCPMGRIAKLASKNIFIGNISACVNELNQDTAVTAAGFRIVMDDETSLDLTTLTTIMGVICEGTKKDKN